jgi:hypothetical protein
MHNNCLDVLAGIREENPGRSFHTTEIAMEIYRRVVTEKSASEEEQLVAFVEFGNSILRRKSGCSFVDLVREFDFAPADEAAASEFYNRVRNIGLGDFVSLDAAVDEFCIDYGIQPNDGTVIGILVDTWLHSFAYWTSYRDESFAKALDPGTEGLMWDAVLMTGIAVATGGIGAIGAISSTVFSMFAYDAAVGDCPDT